MLSRIFMWIFKYPENNIESNLKKYESKKQNKAV